MLLPKVSILFSLLAALCIWIVSGKIIRNPNTCCLQDFTYYGYKVSCYPRSFSQNYEHNTTEVWPKILWIFLNSRNHPTFCTAITPKIGSAEQWKSFDGSGGLLTKVLSIRWLGYRSCLNFSLKKTMIESRRSIPYPHRGPQRQQELFKLRKNHGKFSTCPHFTRCISVHGWSVQDGNFCLVAKQKSFGISETVVKLFRNISERLRQQIIGAHLSDYDHKLRTHHMRGSWFKILFWLRKLLGFRSDDCSDASKISPTVLPDQAKVTGAVTEASLGV